jgi:hypothetical protein
MELGSSHGYAMFTVVAITVLREGIESVIFLAGGCMGITLCNCVRGWVTHCSDLRWLHIAVNEGWGRVGGQSHNVVRV